MIWEGSDRLPAAHGGKPGGGIEVLFLILCPTKVRINFVCCKMRVKIITSFPPGHAEDLGQIHVSRPVWCWGLEANLSDPMWWFLSSLFYFCVVAFLVGRSVHQQILGLQWRL